MGDILSFVDRKKAKEGTSTVKDDIIKAFDELKDFDVDCGIVILRGKNGEALSGFFNTSFVDEALLLKTLDMDIERRQYVRESQDDN